MLNLVLKYLKIKINILTRYTFPELHLLLACKKKENYYHVILYDKTNINKQNKNKKTND